MAKPEESGLDLRDHSRRAAVILISLLLSSKKRMSLYDLLNKPKAKETSHTVNLNRTQVSSSLQNNLSLSVVKPYSKRKSQ